MKSKVYHDEIPEELQGKVRILYRAVGRYLYPTFEQWEFGFCCDLHPEREVAVWTRIALALKKYRQDHARIEPLPHDEAVTLVSALAAISMGADPTSNGIVSPETARELLECYKSPLPKRSGDDGV